MIGLEMFPAETVVAAVGIACSVMSCVIPASRGGIVVVQPNGFSPSHAIYYACDGHDTTLNGAVETWAVR